MAELEQQVAEHNILQREIEAYGQQLRTLVGPVSASLSGLVSQPGRSAGLKGRWWKRFRCGGGHHPTPCFSLALFLSLAEAGCNQHQESIP